eukprot:CAMPEP_0178931294 /NCGR_PEP_ID=MMETSP0786-20121207/21831_1 /TAXON_ID=186022 /ORGANISM="Thalassionema frauenfeldii, Strain CCMP 1798" /LENGTH=162 /DNA_ID=CAMNT_0020608157 /DNA_START=54 /DNA_END=542 /DNA_ORIENTATION=-
MSAAMASLLQTAGKVPVPLFGSLSTLTLWGANASRKFPAAAGWAFPAVVGGLWFVWPAVDQEWKEEMGFARKVIPPGEAPAPKPVALDDSAKDAIANAYKADGGHKPTAIDIQIGKELRMGVTTSLEKEWEAFNEKAIRPGEDDDDEDDDDEDEDDEDEDDE